MSEGRGIRFILFPIKLSKDLLYACYLLILWEACTLDMSTIVEDFTMI